MHLYSRLIEHDLLTNSMNPVLKFLIRVGETISGLEYLKEDPELLYIMCKNYFCIPNSSLWSDREFTNCFINFANTIPGSKAILECNRQLITPYLNRIWKADEDELSFLSGSDRAVEETVFDFMKIIFTLTFSLNCVQSLLSNDTDDESTLVDSDKKASHLRDLIDDALNTSGPGTVSCYVGLLSIRMLISNLNILIFIERTMNLQEQLQLLQSECTVTYDEENQTTVSNSDVIIDECSLVRQNIINFIQNVGTVKHGTQNMFKTMKPQRIHSSAIPSAKTRRLNDFQRFLNDTRNNLHDQGWLYQARKTYRQCCGDTLKESVFIDLIQQVRLTVPNTKSYFIWPDNERILPELFPEDLVGISLIVRFGANNKILQPSFQYETVLAHLLKQVSSFLNIERDKFDGFDWFVGIVFLICGGNMERTKIVLQCMVHLPVTPYIWSVFGKEMSIKRNWEYASHFEHTLSILIEDLEIFKPALESAGISWNALTRNWIDQCYFNVLEWSELCNFLAMAVLFPPEHVLYYLICTAQHLQARFLNTFISNDLTTYQRIFNLDGFRINDWIGSMDQMGKQYKNILSKY
ncbi:hypothetical protein CBL_01464 [Carabus blaptoides fortunei]